MAEKPPCQSQACALQDCLWRSDFQEARCQGALAALRKCCRELLARGGASRCCPSGAAAAARKRAAPPAPEEHR
ncbi:hypothetical protein H4R21_002864 [Coemansia helicoidea]|uniref:Uncharacterized protein n=1 Tax=Coemansia helicoidea TaxID=1286919 RepID=A0ACC1L4E5_9FUNG|nr:hypothetical protein H4R21_002864 [Coemansia helicoidea]